MNKLQRQVIQLLHDGISIRKRDPITSTIYNQILSQTEDWPHNTKIRERVYIIVQGLKKPLTCECGSLLPFLGPTNGYRSYCSVKCRGSSVAWRIKQEQSFQEKYGVNRPAQHSTVRTKIKSTTLRNHNVQYSQQSLEVRSKTKNTNANKYGCENFTQTAQFQTQLNQTLAKRYAGRSPNQSHISTTAWAILQDRDQLAILNNSKNLVQIADDLEVSVSLVSRYFHQYQLSPISHFNSSIPEQELKNVITNLGVTGIFNTRKIIAPKELDIYLPSFNMAIEFCGLYWHSDIHDRIDQNYHLNKMLACQDQGIQLLTFFEDEWYEKRPIIEDMLKHRLQQHQPTFARKCTITNVTTKEKKVFFNQTHIQGTGHGSVSYGLIHENSLVACITFINRGLGLYELNRYSTVGAVTGGFSRLLKHFQQHNDWNKIISFADRRFSVGNLYLKNGFHLANTSKPSYSYTVNKKRFHRKTFMKQFLPKYLPTFDSTLTEWENMDNHNIHRIWDCGQLRFELNRDYP